MDQFSTGQLRELAQARHSLSVSLFMPTNHVEAELGQNPIRLKNLCREARTQLKEEGFREADIDATLTPLSRLIDDERYWLKLSNGLAAFLTPDTSKIFRLPLDFEELVVTGSRFHLKPLFPLFASNNRFYILALSQNNVRLFLGTHYSIQEVQSTDIPTDIVDALLKYEDPERSLQGHVGMRFNGSGGRQDHIVHGQGVTEDDVSHRPKDLIWRYFNEIDEGVRETLQDETAPLLLAGVEYYLPIYRETNTYQHLVGDAIVSGNPDHLTAKELHAKAWTIMEPLFGQAQNDAISNFKQSLGRDKLASRALKEIIPAAVFSRIDTLFVPIGTHVWGRYDPDANTVEIHDVYQAGDDDLLDLAAVNTYLNGGRVHALQVENMPVEEPLAATFRYPADVEAAES